MTLRKYRIVVDICLEAEDDDHARKIMEHAIDSDKQPGEYIKIIKMEEKNGKQRRCIESIKDEV